MPNSAPRPSPPAHAALPRANVLHTLLLASRWIHVPVYLGLMLVQAIYVIKFLHALWHLVEGLFGNQAALAAIATEIGYASPTPVISLSGAFLLLAVLELVEMALIASLLLMVTVGGYKTFVKNLKLQHYPGHPEWLGHMNVSVLKMKFALAIISISSINLLETFINAEHYADRVIIAQSAMHLVFLVSALAIAVTDKISSSVPHEDSE